MVMGLTGTWRTRGSCDYRKNEYANFTGALRGVCKRMRVELLINIAQSVLEDPDWGNSLSLQTERVGETESAPV